MLPSPQSSTSEPVAGPSRLAGAGPSRPRLTRSQVQGPARRASATTTTPSTSASVRITIKPRVAAQTPPLPQPQPQPHSPLEPGEVEMESDDEIKVVAVLPAKPKPVPNKVSWPDFAEDLDIAIERNRPREERAFGDGPVAYVTKSDMFNYGSEFICLIREAMAEALKSSYRLSPMDVVLELKQQDYRSIVSQTGGKAVVVIDPLTTPPNPDSGLVTRNLIKVLINCGMEPEIVLAPDQMNDSELRNLLEFVRARLPLSKRFAEFGRGPGSGGEKLVIRRLFKIGLLLSLLCVHPRIILIESNQLIREDSLFKKFLEAVGKLGHQVMHFKPLASASSEQQLAHLQNFASETIFWCQQKREQRNSRRPNGNSTKTVKEEGVALNGGG